MNGDANLWRCSRVGVSGQEFEEHGIGTVVELLWGICVDIVSEDVSENLVSFQLDHFGCHSQRVSADTKLLTKGRCLQRQT